MYNPIDLRRRGFRKARTVPPSAHGLAVRSGSPAVRWIARAAAFGLALSTMGCSMLSASNDAPRAAAAEKTVGGGENVAKTDRAADSGTREDGPAGGLTAAAGRTGAPAEVLPVVYPPYIEIWIDTRDQPLGAYTLTLRYDPARIVIQDVGTGDLAKFPDLPRANPTTYATGATPIAGFQTAGLSPTGKTRIATVFFASAGAGVSAVSATLETLVDPEGVPIAGEVVLSTDRVESR